MFENETLEIEVPFDAETGEVIETTPETSEAKGARFQKLVDSVGPLDATVLASSKQPKTRIKRTEKEMIKALGGSPLKEANYVSDRIRKLEDKISELMGSIGQPARQLVLNDNPHLARY